MASRQRNSVGILSNRERGSQTFGSQRLLQLLVEEKVRWMKWQSQVPTRKESHTNIYILLFGTIAVVLIQICRDVEEARLQIIIQGLILSELSCH